MPVLGAEGGEFEPLGSILKNNDDDLFFTGGTSFPAAFKVFCSETPSEFLQLSKCLAEEVLDMIKREIVKNTTHFKTLFLHKFDIFSRLREVALVGFRLCL